MPEALRPDPGGGLNDVGDVVHSDDTGVHFGETQHVFTAQTNPDGHVSGVPVQSETELQRKFRPQNPPPVDSVQQKQLVLTQAMKVWQFAPTHPGLGFETPWADTGVTAPTIMGAT